MKIIEKFKTKKPIISFEIFPPKLDVSIETIYDKLSLFKELNPDFISVTYGAGGTKKDRTIEICSKIKNQYDIECMAHFTCVDHSKEEIFNLLRLLKENNLENILALRGDAPDGQLDFDFSKNSFRYANELINYIRKTNNTFCIAAAAYVEGHIDSKRLKEDILHLKNKVEAGVDLLITQLFFDNRLFYDFLEKVRSFGINCPISPGIMPIFKSDQIKRITSLCGASIPAKLVIMMDKYEKNPEDLKKAGIEYASNQIYDLIENGVDGVHICTMNRPKSTKVILDNLNILQNNNSITR
jgi:methylenetetrahydrofolate reductase (NADPH)